MGGGGDAGATRSGRRISAAEVAKHASAGDGWVAIRGKVYDVSKWNEHPGGRVILSALGQADSTDVFAAFHTGKAYEMLERFYVGELDAAHASKPAATSTSSSGSGSSAPAEVALHGGKEVTRRDGPNEAFEREYRELYAQIRAEGLTKASMLYYAWKFASTTAIVAAAFYVTRAGAAAGSVALQLAGAVLLAVFWQQCGWLAHDFAHHQVFRNRTLNDMAVLVVGDLYQGFSCDWWKSKHNTHHAIPNLHESTDGAHDGDPDIDTLPFLAWSRGMLRKLEKRADEGGEGSALARFCVAHQAALYFPILFFARITWALQSASYVFRFNAGFFANSEAEQMAKVAREVAGGSAAAASKSADAAAEPAYKLHYEVGEKGMLLAHYAWVLALCFGCTSSLAAGVAHFVTAQTVCGLLLAVAFGVGHNGMTVFDARARPGFAELQVRTTRNVHDSYGGLTGWFMGGLHYQVEHHLFPTVPRNNLAKTAPRVRALCAKHGVPYHVTGLREGTAEVVGHLASVSRALADFPAA